MKNRRRAFAAAVGLAAYLVVFVSSPGWHAHADGGACDGRCEPAAESDVGGHCRALDSHAGHDHREPTAKTDEPPDPVGGHDCRLCDLLAQCPLPVTPPVLADAGAPLPSRPADLYQSAEEAFLRTSSARGPPRA